MLVASLLKRSATSSASPIDIVASWQVGCVLAGDSSFRLCDQGDQRRDRSPLAVLRRALVGDLLDLPFVPISTPIGLSRRTVPKVARVGIIWASVDKGRCTPGKSVPLKDLADALTATNWTLVSLQRCREVADPDDCLGRIGIDTVPSDTAEANTASAINELVQALKGLDRIVTISTTTAHLAAAMGVPVELVVAKRDHQQWFWEVQARRSRCIYPTVRIHLGDSHHDERWWEQSLESLRASVAAS